MVTLIRGVVLLQKDPLGIQVDRYHQGKKRKIINEWKRRKRLIRMTLKGKKRERGGKTGREKIDRKAKGIQRSKGRKEKK